MNTQGTFEPGQFRDRFRIPRGTGGEPSIYLVGNSLGAQPVEAVDAVNAELERWARQGVAGHFDGPLAWTGQERMLAESLAELVGAHTDEVAIMGTLTANLHQLMLSFYRPQGARRRLVIEKGAFPSDRHAAASQVSLHGLDPEHDLVELAPRRDGLHHEEDLEDYLERYGEQVALVLWPGVQYATGQVFDLARIARAARRAGAAVGFDLAHAVGNVELALHDVGPDFAAWCHYKYVNAGPGAIAGIFIHRHHAEFDRPRITGWWGHNQKTRFRMRPEFDPTPGAPGWQLSNLPILSAVTLRPALALFAEAGGMPALRRASLALTEQLAGLIEQRLSEWIEIVTPREPHRHGCQLSLRVRAGREQGRRLFERLEAHGVVCDWRQPDIMRAAPVPLYNTPDDVGRFVDLVERLMPT